MHRVLLRVRLIWTICAFVPRIDGEILPLRAKRQFNLADIRDENAIIFDEYNYFDDFVRPSVRIPDARRPASGVTGGTRRTTTTTTRPRPTQGRPTVTAVPIPGMGTTQSGCEDRCPSTNQYNPICGDNDVTYANLGRYRCAVACGQRVNIVAYRACSRVLPTDPTPKSLPWFFK